jgi:methylmalonyl-CoA mutase
MLTIQRRASSSLVNSEWKTLVTKELKGKDPDTLFWNTAEVTSLCSSSFKRKGIKVKPVYTSQDTKQTDEIPGKFPFTRGPYASMVLESLGLFYSILLVHTSTLDNSSSMHIA